MQLSQRSCGGAARVSHPARAGLAAPRLLRARTASKGSTTRRQAVPPGPGAATAPAPDPKPAGAAASSAAKKAPAAPKPAASPAAPAAQTQTTWEAWFGTLKSGDTKWRSSNVTAPPKGDTPDRTALAGAVASAAASYKPKPSLKVPSLDDLGDVPKNLHKRLELVARVQLAHYLGLPLSDVPVRIQEFTTTDIAAACCVAGVKLVTGTKRTALVSVVVTETERQMTWSRLEGLLLHWAVSRQAPPAEKWELPPRGWKTLPDTTVDAGGAWQTSLEKHPLPSPDGVLGPQPMYTMLAALPLEGPLAEGGLIFVLKSGSTGQNTKWLKDARTSTDFFVDLQELKLLMQ